MSIKTKIIHKLFYRKWRKQNGHNETGVIDEFPIDLVTVGKYTYGNLYVLSFNNMNKLFVGNCVSIAPDVSFILSADHYINHLSTFPYRSKLVNDCLEGVSKGDIVIGDDVWIGYGATILSGVHVGQGAVIASGAVVSKDVAPYSVVGGVPAKLIRYRFQQPVIDYLLNLDYERIDISMVRSHVDDLYQSIDNLSLNEIKEMFSWFPKKTVNGEAYE